MANIDKLLDKFNKAQNKVNSFKGIVSDFKSIKYDSVSNTLDIEDSTKYDEALTSLKASQDRNKQVDSALSHVQSIPTARAPQLVYPYHDKLSNYMVFHIRERKKRGATPELNVHKKQSVALYVPDTLISQANVQYRSESIGIFNRTILGVLQDYENFSESIIDNADTLIGAGLNAFVNKISGGLINVSQGVAINPQMEQLFDTVPFRNWDFTFEFFPKSEEEAQVVRDIIYTFRSSMLPDVLAIKLVGDEDGAMGFTAKTNDDTGEAIVEETNAEMSAGNDYNVKDTVRPFYNLPNVVEVEFAGPLGDQIDGFLPSVISNVQVDYTGGQKFSTHADGMPAHIQMTLQLMEIRSMTLNNYEGFVRATNTGTGEFDARKMTDEEANKFIIKDDSLVNKFSRDGYTDMRKVNQTAFENLKKLI